MLDRYGRQVFTEYYFPWLEDVIAAEDSTAPFDDLPQAFCILQFHAAQAGLAQKSSTKAIDSAEESVPQTNNGGVA